MTPDELRLDEAGRWLAQACKDLNAAQGLAALEPSRSVFHSQQAAEKSAKAFLAYRNVPFRKTHDLEELGKQCADLQPSLEPVLTDAERLTDYAVVFRYLDAPYEPDEQEATSALDTARALFRAVKALLLQPPLP